jgi:hypothetical protein
VSYITSNTTVHHCEYSTAYPVQLLYGVMFHFRLLLERDIYKFKSYELCMYLPAAVLSRAYHVWHDSSFWRNFIGLTISVACLKGVCCLIPLNCNSKSHFRKEYRISYKNSIKLQTGFLFYFIFNFVLQSEWRSASAWMCCLCSSTEKMGGKSVNTSQRMKYCKCL